MTPEWRRLHPLSPLVNLVPQAWVTIRWMWPLAAAWVFGRTRGQEAVDAFLVLPFVVMPIVNTLAHFLTLRYRLVDGRLEIESGVLQRTSRSLARDRVQNVEIVRNVFQRLSGLAEVRIETASGREVEGLLSALSLAEADAIVAALGAPAGERPADEPAVEVASNGPLELLWVGATGVRLAALPIAAFSIWRFLVPPGEEPSTAALTWGQTAAFGAFFVTAAFWLSIVGTFLRQWGFRIDRQADRLVVRRGLFTTSRTELARARVQVADVDEGWVRRVVGFATVRVETAAGRSAGDGTERASTAIPYVDAGDLPALLRELLPTVTDPASIELAPPHPAALGRALRSTGVLGMVPAGLAVAGAGPVAVGITTVAWLGLLGFAALATRREGWAMTPDLLVARSGIFTRRTTLVPLSKVQSVSRRTTPLLARRGASLVSVRLAGRSVTLPLLADADTERVYARLAGLPPPIE